MTPSVHSVERTLEQVVGCAVRVNESVPGNFCDQDGVFVGFSCDGCWRYSFISKEYDPYHTRTGSQKYRSRPKATVKLKKSPNADLTWIWSLLQKRGSPWNGSNFRICDAFRSSSVFFGPALILFLTICGAESCLRGLSSTWKPDECDNGRQKRTENSSISSPDLCSSVSKHVRT